MSRTASVLAAAAALMLGVAASIHAQTPHYDLLLKGGHVIDPANHIDRVMDVAVAGGKVAAVEPDIPASEAGKVVDVHGLYVTPGLIDIHVHITQGGAPLNWFSPDARSHIRPYMVNADEFLQSGVTTAVDAGTAGADTFLEEKEEVTDHSPVRVLSWLNIVADGMSGGLEQNVDQMDVQKCVNTIHKYRQYIVGVKTAHYWTEKPWDPEHQPWVGVDRAEACGRMAGVPIMVDFFPRPGRPYSELILKKMRPGDIHTHVFAQQFPIVLPNGKVNPIMWEARKRGVIFDVGHGGASFWFRNAMPAVQQGFLPDSISTDLHDGSIVQLAMSLNNVMSKFLAMGETLEDVIQETTVNPAREIHRTDLGTLSVGSVADIAVLQLLHGHFSYMDDGYARQDGNEKLITQMTVRAGAIVFDPYGLSAVEWQKARKQYYHTPTPSDMSRATADDYPRSVRHK
ncbi:MAG TPA: amidohydrolase/deacetylase family metallohydrolase [Terriglobia bacterium]|nr:amidohydrolase/deacetylase family metallohydrolase [Terriglobia bacterium]